ncbi:threo-3-hydroxy-L-aspartate ammonia-lyase [Acinetobacter calcoaceticus]|uniref:threo-3-hydroxy-L-aspartate ammonia-lyase n=1 Tax=Acinetobacter calcoaceticus TaxID=471 RepID=UPI0022352CED|nr:threo-3-hydroxy-L-aspartate ammonia-lyase [Acinetobacter calcoaceticus]
MMKLNLPTYQNVIEAEKNIKGIAHTTPVLTSTYLNQKLNNEIFFKCENFQKTGAFKFRGALNALKKLSEQQKKIGVVAFSGGNHAQGVALAAQLLNIPATIVMPIDAPKTKIDATKDYGANIIFFDRYKESREKIANELVNQRGAALIPSADHPDVIAGQGTIVKELIDSVGNLDAIFVPVGSGGVLAGTLLTVKKLLPNCEVYGIEPEAGNDGQQSLKEGKIIRIDVPNTIADGAQTQYLGEHCFSIIKNYMSEIDTVQDSELIESMKFFTERLKIVVEPTGCLGLAGFLKNQSKFKNKKIGIIITGGNVDIEKYGMLLE